MRSSILVLAAAVLTGCGGGDGSPSAPPVDLTAVSMAALGGASISGIAGTATNVSVHLTAANGQAAKSTPVAFVITSGGGSLSSPNVTSDGSGNATVTWTLGRIVGANALTATSGTLSAVAFTATGTAGPPASVLASTDVLSANVGRAVSTPPTVTVLDANSNPVAGAAVVFSAANGSGVLSGASQLTNAQGQASVTSWVLGDIPGIHTVTATVAGLPPVSFRATATNPWLVQVSGALTIASDFADEGSLFGSPPNWSATQLLIAPLLSVACQSGTVLVQVFSSRLITQNGVVTYQFDNAVRESATWNEQSPAFNALYHPGPTNAATKLFISRLAAATTFNITFRHFTGGTLFAPNYNMRGLSSVLLQVLAACPGSSVSEPSVVTVAEMAENVSRVIATRPRPR